MFSAEMSIIRMFQGFSSRSRKTNESIVLKYIITIHSRERMCQIIRNRWDHVSKISKARSLSHEVVLRAAMIRSIGKPRSLNCRIIPILVSAFEISFRSGFALSEPRFRLSTLDRRLFGSSCSLGAFSRAISASSPRQPESSSF